MRKHHDWDKLVEQDDYRLDGWREQMLAALWAVAFFDLVEHHRQHHQGGTQVPYSVLRSAKDAIRKLRIGLEAAEPWLDGEDMVNVQQIWERVWRDRFVEYLRNLENTLTEYSEEYAVEMGKKELARLREWARYTDRT